NMSSALGSRWAIRASKLASVGCASSISTNSLVPASDPPNYCSINSSRRVVQTLDAAPQYSYGSYNVNMSATVFCTKELCSAPPGRNPTIPRSAAHVQYQCWQYCTALALGAVLQGARS